MLNDLWLWLRARLVHERTLSHKRRAAQALGIKTKSVREAVREMEEKLASQGQDIRVMINRDSVDQG